ncbi:hypothetical protein PLICRDRAFT_29332 [Plicaturopsis crispa FD-325 SS-3]|nr:hypothetical protein PLICRDRAFT_29332 [Plicaturopsis crispa FD-325 SS-3]
MAPAQPTVNSENEGDDIDDDEPGTPTPRWNDTPFAPETPTPVRAVKSTITDLSTTSASALFTESPVKSSLQLPNFNPAQISPTRSRSRYQEQLDAPPATAREEALQRALREAEQREALAKRELVASQSNAVLLGVYGEKTRDGLGKLLTGDRFYNKVVTKTSNREMEAQERSSRKARKDEYTAAMVVWRRDEDRRKKRNEEKTAQWKVEKSRWEDERDKAKKGKRKPRWKCPVRGRWEKAEEKPKVTDFEDEDDDFGDELEANDEEMDVDDEDEDIGL